MTGKIEKLIVKYLTNSATTTDLDTLSNWISNPANERLFKEYVKTYYAIICSMNNTDYQKTVEELLRAIRNEKSFVRRLKTNAIYKYAAAAVIVFGLGYFFNNSLFNASSETTSIIVNTIKPGTDKATLTLEDGSQIVLEKGASFQTQNANSNGEEIVYNNAATKNQKPKTTNQIAYNYLTIPRGGEFFIKLSDGTQVWLNSESQLKYPVSFVEGKTRVVELVYGEAYFDVSPSTEHKGSKFKVFNKFQEIEVLGTQFNIQAYRDETNIYTTLVEGRVLVSLEGIKQGLRPNQQSKLNTIDNTIKVENVDVYNEISWKDGVFSFDRKPLKEIMKIFARWYDLELILNTKSIENKRFYGALDKDQPIEDILEILKKHNIISSYKINGKKIVIK
ncbi:hypothetical protein BST83_11665 [Polaribacter filamentus]|uniref:Anti-sigma factor n=1 Tax=Polaribacter filamentus TaxID=53483 RepID=A0A2S7KYN5_9FLAO|nr:FecR family protein [Polaribacter filamentus]PQB07737.1 hypothetical protein BST83_11665 [Polaribacter filamentus]